MSNKNTIYNQKAGSRSKAKCSQCQNWYQEGALLSTKEGNVCEKCYEPNEPRSSKQNEEEENDESIEGSNSFSNFIEVKTPEYKEIKGSAKELNAEKFFSSLTHEIKLNIPDAPPPFRADFFRRMFDKWMKLLTCNYLAKYVITDRGGGKSKNAALYLLYRIANEKDNKPYPFLATFLMRNWEENTKMTRPQYERYIDDFTEFFYGSSNSKEKEKWRLTWKTYYRGVEFGDREVMPFIDLYNPAISKKNDIPHQEVFFEEAIPTQEQMLKDGGWITQGGKFVEDTNYSLVYKSASRGITQPRMTFLGNPNIPWVEIWFLLQHWEEELEEISKWYWSNTPKGKDFGALQKWRKWTWTKIYQKEVEGLGLIFLYLEKTEHEPKLIPSEEDWCWHKFFTPAASLNIIPFVNGSEPLYVFNGCICFWRQQTKEDPTTTGYWSWIEVENPRYPNRDTLFRNIYEIVVNEEQEAENVSSGLTEIVRKRDKKQFQLELLRKYRGGLLKFNSSKARSKMLNFISRGKIII